MRPLPLQPPHQPIVQRRDVAILLWRQALQPRLPRMDDKGRNADGGAGIDRGEQADLGVLVVHPDPAFDRGRYVDGLRDRRHTLGHQLRLAHQTGPEAARLDPVGRASNVQIDLVIAVARPDPGRLRQLIRVGPAQLQGHRVFDRIEGQKALGVTVDHRRGRDHLGIEQGARRQCPVKGAAVPVRPVHHGSDGQAAGSGKAVGRSRHRCPLGQSEPEITGGRSAGVLAFLVARRA